MPPTIHSVGGIEVVVGTGLEVDHDRALPEVVYSTNEKYLDTRPSRPQRRHKLGINWNKRYRGVPIYLIAIVAAATLAIGVIVGAAVIIALKERDNQPLGPTLPSVGSEPTSSAHTTKVLDGETLTSTSDSTTTSSEPTSTTVNEGLPTSSSTEPSTPTPTSSSQSISSSSSSTLSTPESSTSTSSRSISSFSTEASTSSLSTSSSSSETTATASPSQPSSGNEENLQTFTGALGGIKASPITRSGDPTRPFLVDGEEMEDFDHAVIHSCDNQRDSCVRIPITVDGSPTARDCSAQKTQCLAVARAAAPST
ncbi:hypothetical protein F5Y04DRAFT_174719 [Hypomontagnella monticulosa]|nr:hypothetical protein F5Y04DRAFT_174719 [Hypomontagnella monticulosa]